MPNLPNFSTLVRPKRVQAHFGASKYTSTPVFLLVLFLSCVLVLFAAPPAAAQTRNCGTGIGVHLAGQWDLNSFAQTAEVVGACGTITLMAYSSELSKLQEVFSYNDQLREQNKAVQIVIRDFSGRARGQVDALSWAATLGSINTQTRINFVPVNEPFRDFGGGNFAEWAGGPQNRDGIAREVAAYARALNSAFAASGINGTKVNLWSPMINQFDAEFVNNVARLKREDPNFANYFAGMTMNLYARYVNGQLTDDSRENGIGYRDVLRDVWGLPNAAGVPVLAGEFGVLEGFPQFVTYPPSLIADFIRNHALPDWGRDPNFFGGSILFYNPDTNRPWLFGSEVEALMRALAEGVTGSPEGAARFEKEAFLAWLATILSQIASCPQGGFAPSRELCSETSPFLLFSGSCPPGENCTELILSPSSRFGGEISYNKNVNLQQAREGGLAPLNFLSFLSRAGRELISRISPGSPDGLETFPAPDFPYLEALARINKRLLPAKKEPKVQTGLVRSYSFNPGCRVAVDGSILSGDDVRLETEGKIEYTMSSSWGEHIGQGKISQALFVPDNRVGSTVIIQNPEAPGDEENAWLSGNCPTGTGAEVDTALAAGGGETQVPKEENAGLFAGIRGFLAGLIANIRDFFLQPRTSTVEFTHVNKNVCVGCEDLGEAITGQEGFVNAFLPKRKTVPSIDGAANALTTLRTNPTEARNVSIVEAATGNIKEGIIKLQKAVTPLRKQGAIPTSFNYYEYPDLPSGLTPDGRLTYEIPMDFPVTISPDMKTKIIETVESNWGKNTLIRENWDIVYNRARSAGINPAFVIAIWIEESGGSDPDLNVLSDFGWAPQNRPTFEQSLNGFIYFTVVRLGNFENWARDFCGPNTPYICSNNPNFLKNLKSWYEFIVQPGSPGAVVELSN